jgi:hypothetical protein
MGGLAVLGGTAITRPAAILAQEPKRLPVGTANILPKDRSGTLPGARRGNGTNEAATALATTPRSAPAFARHAPLTGLWPCP